MISFPFVRLEVDPLVVPVRLERTVARDPVALLQLVPEGRKDPGEGMPDYDERGGLLLAQEGP